jgi:hypothetical protein
MILKLLDIIVFFAEKPHNGSFQGAKKCQYMKYSQLIKFDKKFSESLAALYSS